MTEAQEKYNASLLTAYALFHGEIEDLVDSLPYDDDGAFAEVLARLAKAKAKAKADYKASQVGSAA